jgi:uncharacterized protein with GYD domain
LSKIKWRPATIIKNGANPKFHKRRNNLKYQTMKKYLIKGTYNTDGAKGLIQEGGSGRKAAVEKMLAGMGGKVESFYYAFGKEDVYIVVELPDDISAAAVGLRVNAAGLVRTSTTVLLTPADIDAASKKSVSYRAPGEK